MTEKEVKNLGKILRSLNIKKSSAQYFIIFVCVAVFVAGSYFFENQNRKSPEISRTETKVDSQEYEVEKVVDGDTIDILQNGQKARIRYIGVNTPETVKPNSPVECYGKEASNYNKHLLEGKKVVVESDVENLDKNGRLLRYVYLKNEKGELEMVNKKLVEEGYAYEVAYPPNVKYREVFKEAQKSAQQKEKGLWKECKKN